MTTLRAVPAVVALACVMACTPVLDWRDVRPPGAGLVALFPCKPASHARRIVLADTPVEMIIYACSAGGATYAVGFADLGQPAQVGRGLSALAEASARNIGSTLVADTAPVSVPGMTPNPQAQRLSLVGRLGDGGFRRGGDLLRQRSRLGGDAPGECDKQDGDSGDMTHAATSVDP